MTTSASAAIKKSFAIGQNVKIPNQKLTGKVIRDEFSENNSAWSYGVLIKYSKPKSECPFDLRWFWEDELEA